jgi:hypothetical protein
MSNLVLIAQAVEGSIYSQEHITRLVREKRVKGQKIGGTWLVDLEDLKRYEQEMTSLGHQKHTGRRRHRG